MYDVIIVGAGPAGISAGLYAKRANLDVLILYYENSAIEKTEKIDNYYGFPNGVSGKQLYENGIVQAKMLGIEIKKEEIINIENNLDSKYIVKSQKESYEAKAVIIATGNKKIKPNIIGIDEYEGKGISYCAICDGFFYRNKNVVVLGNGEFALSEADDLKNIVGSLKILTNGLNAPENCEYEVDIRRIKQIYGDIKVSHIEFEDGEKMEVDGIFIAQGVAGGCDFAKKLGVMIENDKIIVNENMETNLKGLYACGDITGGIYQISKAVYDGAKAGLEVTKYIKSL